MATLENQSIASTYKDLLKINAASYQAGVDGNLRKVEDGDATATSLSISTDAIAIDTGDKLGFDGTNSGTYITESADGVLDFYADAVRTMTLIENGGASKVGIGTASPDSPLEVVGGFKAGSAVVDAPAFNDHVVVLCDGNTSFAGGLLITNQDSWTSNYSSAKLNVTSSAGSGTADLMIGVVDNEAPNTYIRKWMLCNGANGAVAMGDCAAASAAQLGVVTSDVMVASFGKVEEVPHYIDVITGNYEDSYAGIMFSQAASASSAQSNHFGGVRARVRNTDAHSTIEADLELLYNTGDDLDVGLVLNHDDRCGIFELDPDTTLHVTGKAGTNLEVVKIEQLDDNEAFINFVGTTASDDSKSISTDTTVDESDKYGAIAIEVNGTKKWLRVYDTHS